MKQRKVIMKATLMSAFLLYISFSGMAQDNSKRPSPPAEISKTISGGISVSINYSQPAVKGRTIWGGLVPYSEVWRTGANEATWIEVSEDVMICESKLPKGKYSLFTIPGEQEWIIIFNKKWKQWGAYEYKESKDVLRITAIPSKSEQFTEQFTMAISESGEVSLNWENVSVKFELNAISVN